MTKIQKFLVASLLLVGASAFALQQLDDNVSRFLTAIRTGLLVGPASVNTTDARINANRITRSLGATATVDFAAGTILCDDSAAITVTGARIGDACSVGEPGTLLAADGGAVQATFSCRVSAANAVKIRHCPAGTADDPLSGSFKVRVTSAL